MEFIPQTLTPAQNDQNFITYYLQGVCPTQWEGWMRRHSQTLLIVAHWKDKGQQS